MNKPLNMKNLYMVNKKKHLFCVFNKNKFLNLLYFSSKFFKIDFTAVCIIGEFRNENATASIDRLLKKVASIKAQEIIQVN